MLGIAILFFVLGSGFGFGVGVLSVKSARQFFVGLFDSEQTAEVRKPLHAGRAEFDFEYPSADHDLIKP
jgi:hypothetical protein